MVAVVVPAVGAVQQGRFLGEAVLRSLWLANRALEETGGVFEPASLIAFRFYLIVGGFIPSLLSRTYYGGFDIWHGPTWRRA